MPGRHAAEWSIWTEPKHTTEIPVVQVTRLVTLATAPIPLPATQHGGLLMQSASQGSDATQHSGRFTPSGSKGDPFDVNGRTL